MQVSDKETRAVFLNFKELRCLEKNLQVLDIEKAYSISLINLDQKVVKLSHKQLRDKVTKIKSHLPEGEVDELRWLDKMGKLDAYKSASQMNFNVRIAAAEKRLKLQKRAKSAVPRIETSRTTPCTPTPRSTVSALSSRRCSTRLMSSRSPSAMDRTGANKTKHSPNVETQSRASENTSDYLVPNSVREERRRSIFGLEVNDDKSGSDHERKPSVRDELLKRQDSSSNVQTESKLTNSKDHKNEPVTIKLEAVDEDASVSHRDKINTSKGENISKYNPPNVSFLDVPGKNGTSKTFAKGTLGNIRPVSVPAMKVTSFVAESRRPYTSISRLNDVKQKCAASIRRASKMLASGKTETAFSCHNNIDDEAKPKSKAERPFRSIRDGVYAEVENGPMEHTRGNNLYKEIKRGLMLGEVATSLQLEDKIDYYMDKVQTYVEDNPTSWKPYEPEKEPVYYTPGTRAVDAKKKTSSDKPVGKPVRNKVRRRQLEFKLRQGQAQNELFQNNFGDIKQSRYIKIPDNLIDVSRQDWSEDYDED